MQAVYSGIGTDGGIAVKQKKHHCRAVIATAPCGQQAVYPSVSAAAQEIGGQVSRITYASRTGTTYKGIHWMYAEEAEKTQ